MSTLTDEMYSFVAKLSQLTYCGINASLNLHTVNGRVYASLHADLGCSTDTMYVAQNYHTYKRTKPSRLKRQAQRKKAFENGEKEDATPSIDTKSESDAIKPVPTKASSTIEDQIVVSTDTIISEDSSSCSEPFGEHFPAQDDDTPWTWTPPSPEDMLHYLREHGHPHQQDLISRLENDTREKVVQDSRKS